MIPEQNPPKQLFNLKDLLGEQLRDMYNAESQYAAQLPEMISRATSSHLQEKLRDISARVTQNAEDLSTACGLVGVVPDGVTCEAMKGLVREAKDVSLAWGDSATEDAALISSAQRIAHYEIAGFGTARAFARVLKLPEVTQLLQPLLVQAFRDDKDLSYIANGGWLTQGVNQEALPTRPAESPEDGATPEP